MADDNVYRVIDDGVIYTYTATDNSMSAIFEENGIETGSKDKVDISCLETDSLIVIDRYKNVYVKIDDEIRETGTYFTTVKEVLTQLNIDMSNKKLYTESDTKVVNGLVIDIRTQRDVTFVENGHSRQIFSYGNETVEEFLERNNIEIGEYDYISADKNSFVKYLPDRTLEYKSVVVENISETQSINYETNVRYNSEIAAGQKKVVQSGSTGKKKIDYKVIKYYDDTIISKEEINSTIIKEPQNEIIEIGTKPGNGKTYNGISVGDIIDGHKSHYCVCMKCCGKTNGVTASGIKIQNGMNDPYIIACNWLPIGAVIDIDGKIYTVADRGGSRLSNTGYVDIFTPEGHKACLQKGVGSCKITILSL